ncbi:hypothetical protein N0V86_003297 [Didymella sp. IMI 355093]|nr:hypothetical protein N0V86_003297 [Didymella sp. IMI 355093]
MTLPKFFLGSALVAGTLVNGFALPAPARQSLSVRRRVDLAPLRVPNLPVAKRQDEDEPVPTPDFQPMTPEPLPTPIEEEPVPTPDVPFFPDLPEDDLPSPVSPVDKELEVDPVPTPDQPSFPELRQDDLTCVGKDQEATFTYTTSAGNYDILCGKDYLNADLSSLRTETFADCLTACNEEVACATVAYANGFCYLKNQVTTTVPNASVWAAKKQNAKESLTCVEGKDNGKTYPASKGQYNIICGKEYAGGDLVSTSTASFEACIEACVSTDGCIDVSYVNGACYMKNTKTSLIEAGHVWTAELIRAESTPKVEEFSCIDGKDNGKIYNAPSGKKYTIECGIDHAGGDFLTIPHETTFQSCMDVCDVTPECGIELSHVWTGRLIGEE